MRYSALFLLAVAIVSGCSTIESARSWVRDSQRPQEGAEALEYRKLFEAGRRSEFKGDIRIASDTYGWLIGRGNRYGEYGLAKLLHSWNPGCDEAIKYFLNCAKRSSHTSDLFPDSAMDSAFSAAAMVELSEIAISDHDRQDIADSLQRTMSGIVTQEVRAWADEMDADSETKEIYKDIISAVRSCEHGREYVKVLKWSEISKAFVNGAAAETTQGGANAVCQTKSSYSVLSFVKNMDAPFQYDFEVQLSGGDTLEAADKVRSAIRRQLVKEFRDANPHDSVSDIRTSFPSWRQLRSTIKGSAVAMKVSAVRLEYDQLTKHGKIAVRLDGRNVDAARKWAIENIEELATGKNIVLVAGNLPPPGAQYRIGSERTTDDGLLEIEFSAYE